MVGGERDELWCGCDFAPKSTRIAAADHVQTIERPKSAVSHPLAERDARGPTRGGGALTRGSSSRTTHKNKLTSQKAGLYLASRPPGRRSLTVSRVDGCCCCLKERISRVAGRGGGAAGRACHSLRVVLLGCVAGARCLARFDNKGTGFASLWRKRCRLC